MQQVKEAKKLKQSVKSQLTQKKQTKSPVQEQVIEQTVKEVEESTRKNRPKRKLNKKQTAKQACRAKHSRKKASSYDSVGLHLNTAGTSEAAAQYFCLYCKDKYTEPATEDWIRCDRCLKWCHASCAPSDDVTFVCDYCLYA